MITEKAMTPAGATHQQNLFEHEFNHNANKPDEQNTDETTLLRRRSKRCGTRNIGTNSNGHAACYGKNTVPTHFVNVEREPNLAQTNKRHFSDGW